MDIKETKDYEQFKAIPGNRRVKSGHVESLAGAMAKRNLLSATPILVNEKMEVIDGQHRLEAAKQLNLPIKYAVVNNFGLSEVQMLNAYNKPWTLLDYLQSYVSRGFSNYMKMQQFVEAYGMSISMSLVILDDFNTNPYELQRQFKEGNFTVTDDQIKAAEQFAGNLEEIKPYCAMGVWHDREFVRALGQFFSKYSPQDLVNRLKEGKRLIYRQISTADYYRLLQSIMEGK